MDILKGRNFEVNTPFGIFKGYTHFIGSTWGWTAKHENTNMTSIPYDSEDQAYKDAYERLKNLYSKE